FTDPGGSTYFNQLSFFDVSGIEIIKVPGSSLYGAGTGGVMLLKTMDDSIATGFSVNYSKGSFNTDNLNMGATATGNNFSNKISWSHQASNGYRQQSAMRRDLASWQTIIKAGERQSLTAYVMYGDLFYQTPGGLNRQQYVTDPRAARPATATLPGAVENNAAVYQKTFWAGIQQQYRLDKRWENSTSLYGAYSQVSNSAILNYERRKEPHFGGRTTFGYSARILQTDIKLTTGAEFQQGYFSVDVYKNNGGFADSIRTDDAIDNRQFSFFTQASLVFPRGWIATAGVSINKVSVQFSRNSIVPAFIYNTDYNNEWAPRFSLLKKITPLVSLYAVVAKGFSPPTVSELLPSTSVINTDLQAEQGTNYEAGARGGFIRNRLNVDINVFYFRLKNAITQRRDASGADYFINAGSIPQKGLEASVSFQLGVGRDHFISEALLWASYTYNHFRYNEFKQGNNDFSGNPVPGIVPHTLAGGIDIACRPGVYLSLSYFYSDAVPLNDANLEYGSSYGIPAFRAGYRKQWGRHLITDVFIAGDNLFNERYSLGNDINAAGNRYYNTAPEVNYQAGVRFQLL
ncbi:MAG: TonB-dependent receptor, partial [Chitinophagaceae bacterium]|nr:TonB-dependent receptor [Chitinophagaceae bacterium]